MAALEMAEAMCPRNLKTQKYLPSQFGLSSARRRSERPMG